MFYKQNLYRLVCVCPFDYKAKYEDIDSYHNKSCCYKCSTSIVTTEKLGTNFKTLCNKDENINNGQALKADITNINIY